MTYDRYILNIMGAQFPCWNFEEDLDRDYIVVLKGYIIVL